MEKSKRTRVLFLLNATTHYYNHVLNKLDSETEYEIHFAAPKERFRNVGAGVFQTADNLKIPLYELDEVAHRVWKCYFPELLGLLWKLRPKVIVTLEYYQWGFFWHPLVFLTLKLLNIKVVLKSIPFQLDNYQTPTELLTSQLGRKPNLGDFWKNRKLILNKLWAKWFYSKSFDAHVCYTQKAYEIYPTYGVKKDSIFLTYNSPDTDLLMSINERVKREEPSLPFNPHRLIHVGRLVEWKRVDLIIRAVHSLQAEYPDVELLVLGYGPMEDEWKALAQSLGLGEKIKFIGGVYDLNLLGKYFRASGIYVLGGMGGLSINDAMSFERPIICSVCDGTEAHLVKDGYNGFYFENGNAEDMAKKIEMIFSQPELAERMSQNSYSIIKNEININRVVEGYGNAFKYVMKT